MMTRHAVCAIQLICLPIIGCGGSTEEPTPVATPSLTVNAPVVVVGRPIELAFRFEVAADAASLDGDYTVFVHFIDDGGELIGTSDHEPPTPTGDWRPGSTVEYTLSTFAPTTVYTGPVTVAVGLYSPASGERLPLAGETIEPGAVSVATFQLQLPIDPHAILFAEGWNVPESPPGSGIEWRWSTNRSRLSFVNPRQDVTLVLQLDQPNDVFPEPQRVEIRLADATVDAFTLPTGETLLRRVALGQDVLGDADNADVVLEVDKTFVPARTAGLESTDTRELGVRVFRAYVETKR